MKSLLPTLLLLILGAARVSAITAPHFAVLISGNYTIQQTSGTGGFTVASAKFNNAVILSAIVGTGTSGVSSPAELDIVFDEGSNLNVINKTTHATVFELGKPGPDSATVGGFFSGPIKHFLIHFCTSGYVFQLPGKPVLGANTSETFNLGGNGGILNSLVVTLEGGNDNFPNPGGSYLRATIRKNKAVYNY